MHVKIPYQAMKMMIILLIGAFAILPIINSVSTDMAYGAIQVGGEEIEGYQPEDVITVDQRYALDTENTANQLETVVIKLVKIVMPLLMLVCVVLIIYNAARNIVRKPEDRVKMGDLIKNMFINFFFILFAWIIVEGIVFVVTNGEMILFSTILS